MPRSGDINSAAGLKESALKAVDDAEWTVRVFYRPLVWQKRFFSVLFNKDLGKTGKHSHL